MASPRAPSSGPLPASTCRRRTLSGSSGGIGRGESERGLLLEECLDLAGLLLDAADEGLQVLVRLEVRRRRSHLAGEQEGGTVLGFLVLALLESASV